ncbi:alpha/beta hydrolase [Brevibacillus massiliensis]|uniref:alpha/beta hydrolase n=1 Tax=Brevibacillus massiliensis TaxID=1118054 RepID=UPI0002DAC76A|nr:alpha/beta hydrolase [Brevibacillus massiliensis]
MIHSFEIPLEDQLVIRGDVHVQEDGGEALPVLFFCHGFKGFKDWGSFPYAAEELSKRGIAVIRFNFSCNGVGKSLTEFDELEKFAVNTYEREVADLQALLAALHEGRLPAVSRMNREKLFVLGHSKGGGDAILFGAHNPAVTGLITWNGIASVDLFDAALREQIKAEGVGYIANARTGQQMPISRVVIDDVDQHLQEYDLLAKVADMPQPLLIVQGDKDYARLVNGARKLHQAAAHGRLHWIRGGDHTWNTKHPFAGTSPQLEEAIEVTAGFVHQNV